MSKIHVLCVEDNPADRALISEFFRSRQHCQLHFVTDGESALNFLGRRDAYAQAPVPSLILLDYNLPRISGLDTLKRIKANPEWRPIPVIVLTSSANPRDIAATYENYGNCFLTKPMEIDEFERTIGRIETFWLSTVTRQPAAE